MNPKNVRISRDGRPLFADRHGMSGQPIYWRWRSMIARCTMPLVERYPRYGGRGIRVCERWMTFENFLADMGIPGPGMSIDRIDNDGNYEPGNCRWVDRLTQGRNSSAAKLSDEQVAEIITDIRAGQSIMQVARKFSVSKTCVFALLKCRGIRSTAPKSKLNADQAREIYARALKGERTREIAAAFCVSAQTVQAIASGQRWVHATGAQKK